MERKFLKQLLIAVVRFVDCSLGSSIAKLLLEMPMLHV